MPNHTPLLSSDASFLKAGLVDVGLHLLLQYAMHHEHSRSWISAIATLLTREARAHG
jgi:hypothetical protein